MTQIGSILPLGRIAVFGCITLTPQTQKHTHTHTHTYSLSLSLSEANSKPSRGASVNPSGDRLLYHATSLFDFGGG